VGGDYGYRIHGPTEEKIMPCDTINTATVDLGKADPKLLESAMKALYPGFQYTFDKVSGELNVVGRSRVDVPAIKREMAKQNVLNQAKRFGWSVKEQENGKLLIQKARF
jgi:hypothetical protein